MTTPLAWRLLGFRLAIGDFAELIVELFIAVIAKQLRTDSRDSLSRYASLWMDFYFSTHHDPTGSVVDSDFFDT